MRVIQIGRNASNDIVYNEPSISGNHADLTIGDDGQMILSDHSTNGTIVNGQPLHQSSRPVSFGDSILFPGGFQLDWNQVAAMVQPATPPQMPQMPPQPQFSPMDLDMNASAGYTSGGGNYSISYGGNDGGFGGGSLSFNQTFSDAWASGKRNALPMFLAMLLAGLTCWIPYLGFGVIIALMTLPREWAKETRFSPLSIFDRKYRERMADFMMFIPFYLLTLILSMFVVPYAGLYIFGIAWMLAPLFLMNKETSFIEAIRSSWRATYGHKWLIFGILIVYGLVAGIVMGLAVGLVVLLFTALAESSIGAAIALAILFGLVAYGVYILVLSVGVGVSGSIWKQLVGNIEE